MQDINQVRVYATHSEKVFALEETHIFLLPLFRLFKNCFDLETISQPFNSVSATRYIL